MVLMNPPFGDGSKQAKSYIEKAYPRTKNDLYAAFVECGLRRLLADGLLGAITSRTGFFLTSFKKWREEILLQRPGRRSSPTSVTGCSTRRWSKRRRIACTRRTWSRPRLSEGKIQSMALTTEGG